MRFDPATVDLKAQHRELRHRFREPESSMRQPQESFKEFTEDTTECLKEQELEQHKVDRRERLKDFTEYLRERTADPMEPHKDSELEEEIQEEKTLGQQRQHSAEPLVNPSSELPQECRSLEARADRLLDNGRREPAPPQGSVSTLGVSCSKPSSDRTPRTNSTDGKRAANSEKC